MSRSGRLPESGEGAAVGRLPQLLECPLPDLADALARHAHQGSDLLERHGLPALVEPIVEEENLPLARGEVFPEDALDELLHELVVRGVLDLGSVDAGETLAEGGGFTIRAVDRCVERDFGGAHLLRRADLLGRLLEESGDLVLGGIALEDQGEDRLGAGETDELRVLVERDSDAAGLLGEGLQYGLTHPPDGVGDELDALIRIELSYRLEETFVADRDQLREIETVPLILLHVGDHEPEVRRDESLGGGFVTLLGQSSQTSLFGGVTDQRKFLDVV